MTSQTLQRSNRKPASAKPRPRPRAKPKPKSMLGGTWDPPDARWPFLLSLYEVGRLITNANFADDEEIAEGVGMAFEKFCTQTKLFLRDLRGQPRPKAGDLVVGDAHIFRGAESARLRFWGKVVGIEECGAVRLRFTRFDCESDCGRDWDKAGKARLRKIFHIHAGEMEWNEVDGEWKCEI